MCQVKLVGQMPETNAVGNAFAKALAKMLKDEKLTITAAANQLQVSRQSFHSYLHGALPRRKTLNRAVHGWNLKLDLGKYSFGKEAFGRDETTEDVDAAKPSQRTLWEVLDAVKEEDLHVTMKRVGKVLRVDVRIEIPA
jgi:hypothetical protein